MNKDLSRPLIWILGLFAIGIAIFIALRLSLTGAPIRPSADPTAPQALPSPGVSPTSGPSLPTPSAAERDQSPYDPVRLAWFYKPPDDSMLPILARNFDVFILTHKDERQRDVLKSLGVKSPIFVYLQLV